MSSRQQLSVRIAALRAQAREVGVLLALVDRLPDLDPSRVTTTTRRVATRVAADQVRAAQRKNRRDRCVEVPPGPDGTTIWWAQLPAAASAAAWSAVSTLADTYAEEDPSLTVDQARADALVDLLLTNVDVRARVTLGIPVITGAGAPPTTVSTDPPVAVGCQGLGDGFRISAALSGCELPGIGFIDADAVEALLSSVPLEVGRALLDARTPWPHGPTSPANLGDLCRRHHRLKQRRRWAYHLARDGTATWTSPTGKKRTTLPEHATWPPPATPSHARARRQRSTAVLSPPGGDPARAASGWGENELRGGRERGSARP